MTTHPAHTPHFDGSLLWRPDMLPLTWLMAIVLLLILTAFGTTLTGYLPRVPRAKTWTLYISSGAVTVGIERRGGIYLHEPGRAWMHLAPGLLAGNLRGALARHPGAAVELIADQDVGYERISAVLAAAGEAGARTVMAVTREPRQNRFD